MPVDFSASASATAPDNIEVRPLRRDDRPALAALIATIENFTVAERECALELVDIAIQDIILNKNEERRDYLFVVADDAAAGIVAYACWGPVPLTRGTFDLYWIAARPDARRRGLGRVLLGAIEARLRREGGRLLVAETSAQTSYQGTITFYRRLNFQEVSHIRDFYDVGDDRLIFIKKIGIKKIGADAS